MSGIIELNGCRYERIPDAPPKEEVVCGAPLPLRMLWWIVEMIVYGLSVIGSLIVLVLVCVFGFLLLDLVFHWFVAYTELSATFQMYWFYACTLDYSWGCWGLSWIAWFWTIYRPYRMQVYGAKLRRIFEKAVEGSKFVSVQTGPRFQFSITTIRGYEIGQGFRAEVDGRDMLVTACHVVSDDESYVLVGKGGGKCIVRREDFILRPGFDVAYLPFSAEMVVLGLAKARLGKVKGTMTVECGTSKNRSLGSLSSFDFHKLAYGGSTIPGFSGAPYAFGNFVFGVHQGSVGDTNYGFNSAMLPIALKVDAFAETVEQHESSEDWIFEQVMKGADYEFSSTGNPDMITLRVGHNFWLLDEDDESQAELVRKIKNKNKNKNKNIDINEVPESAIPLAETPSATLIVDDQVAGPSFLGQRQKIQMRQSTSQILKTPTNTPPIVNSATAGPSATPKQCGDHTTSTKTSPPKQTPAQKRRSLLAACMELYPNLPAGDQMKVLQSIGQPVSTAGLAQLLIELQQTLTGKPPLATAP